MGEKGLAFVISLPDAGGEGGTTEKSTLFFIKSPLWGSWSNTCRFFYN
ncbi:hypothetical protein C943_04217 [Mariniradius saccharolyticus AK6]|uniref:Uncharacterized protein n=1 Tax=Mariniradius saccharolyticus AK6 TaxID=1239962 RepID=M7XH97_9BACT|nr:hypothetical protein C943_04217 [Mariniradius saccharolyticus AK6]